MYPNHNYRVWQKKSKEGNLSYLPILQALSFHENDLFDKILSNRSYCVRKQALRNCDIGRWCPFVCDMALSGVLGLPVIYLFLESKDKSAFVLCNAVVLPRHMILRSKSIYLLWFTLAMPTKEFTLLRPNQC